MYVLQNTNLINVQGVFPQANVYSVICYVIILQPYFLNISFFSFVNIFGIFFTYFSIQLSTIPFQVRANKFKLLKKNMFYCNYFLKTLNKMGI